jgi:acetyltransferase-like isoleucine patch superfamily enzyme
MDTNAFILKLKAAYKILRAKKKDEFNRYVSFGDLVSERVEIAAFYNFGEGTTCYDNVVILGDVKIGKNTWIGPNVILDGSGGLEIGDSCSISAGVQIYSHDSVMHALTNGREPMAHSKTFIGSSVYIGPNSVIQRGVEIGDRVIIGAMSFVNQNIPSGSKAWGNPVAVRGELNL